MLRIRLLHRYQIKADCNKPITTIIDNKRSFLENSNTFTTAAAITNTTAATNSTNNYSIDRYHECKTTIAKPVVTLPLFRQSKCIVNTNHNNNNNKISWRSLHTTSILNKRLPQGPLALISYRVPTTPTELQNIPFIFPAENATKDDMLEIVTFVFHDRIADYVEEATKKCPEQVHATFFNILANRIISHTPKLDSDEVSRIVFQYAKLGYLHEPMFMKLSKHAHKYHENFNGTESAMVLWSYAVLNFPLKKMYYSMSRNVIREWRRMSFCSLTNSLYAYALSPDYQNPHLTRQALKRLNTCCKLVSTRDLVNATWSFARVTPYIHKTGSYQNLINEICTRKDITAQDIYLVGSSLHRFKVIETNKFWLNIRPRVLEVYDDFTEEHLDFIRKQYLSFTVVPLSAKENYDSFKEKIRL